MAPFETSSIVSNLTPSKRRNAPRGGKPKISIAGLLDIKDGTEAVLSPPRALMEIPLLCDERLAAQVQIAGKNQDGKEKHPDDGVVCGT